MFSRIPFLRFAFGMIAGILLEIYSPEIFHFEFIIFSVLVVFYLVLIAFAARDLKNLLSHI